MSDDLDRIQLRAASLLARIDDPAAPVPLPTPPGASSPASPATRGWRMRLT
jgi:hypothetical protein